MKALHPAEEAQLAARVFELGFLCGAVRNHSNPNDTLTNTRTRTWRACDVLARGGERLQREALAHQQSQRKAQARERECARGKR
jgi:hypothetical protein